MTLVAKQASLPALRKKVMAKKKQPVRHARWVCHSCGVKYGNKMCGVATWHPDTCDVCGKEGVAVTEPRDFGYLDEKWLKHNPPKR